MKFLKHSSLLFITLLLFSSFTINTDKTYVGKWKGQDKGDIGFLTLSQDGYATFEFDGQTMGGKSYTHQGVTAAMKYEVDTSNKPYSIDFIIIDNANKEELGRLIGIIEMTNSNEMRMAMTFGGGTNRPSNFSSDAIVFNRYKE